VNAVLLGLCLVVAVPAQGTPSVLDEEWKFDVIKLTKGREPMKGLVVDETTTHIHIKRVFRRRGSPTVVLEDRIAKTEVAKIERLNDKDREQLTTRLETLGRERQLLLAHLRLREGEKVKLPPGEELTLTPVKWVDGGKNTALLYESTHFRLLSNAREDIVQLTGIQLEQLYTAFVRCLPPRHKVAQPTTIVLAGSVDHYLAIVKKQKLNILNPAYYDSGKNEVVCGSDLERLANAMEKVRQKHEKDRIDLMQRKTELNKIYNGRTPPELLKPINDALQQMPIVEMRNEQGFKTSHRRLYQRLYHEAFHAYLASAVYPEKEGPLPLWLNEGLAQIFETGIVEAGEMRLGHADPERRAMMLAAFKKNELLSLTDLLKASPKEYLVGHTEETQTSQRHYLAAWALSFYLTFDRQLLGTKALDEYARNLHKGTDPLEAFRLLVDQPLAEFEKDWRTYLQHLREDGTTSR